MQFRDLKTQYAALKDEMDKAILDVVASSAYVMGPKIKEMEQAFAEYVGVKHCIACNSGTDALLLALMAWGVKEGDAVFVPSFTFFASAEVIANVGATPVFVDVDENTFNIDIADLEHKIEQTVKAGKLASKVIIAVDLFGLPADFNAIRKIADKYHLLFWKMVHKALAVALKVGRLALSVILPRLLSSRQNLWVAMVMAVLCSPTILNGRS